MKFRATYMVNGKSITNYLSASSKAEAKKALATHLGNIGSPKDRSEIVKSSEIAPVKDWDELVKLLRHSMSNDLKRKGKKSGSFGSLGTEDFHLMLDLVRKNPEFVKTHLSSLPQDMQWHFKKAYNALSHRDLEDDLEKGKKSFWGGEVKHMLANYGNDIKTRLNGVKTRRSPGQPMFQPSQSEQPPMPPQAPMMPTQPQWTPLPPELDDGWRPR